MKLYYHPFSFNCFVPLFMVHHLQLNVDLVVTDPSKGKTRTPEYLKINPNAKIPALTDGDYSLWESNAIAIYLANQKPNEFQVNDIKGRCDIARWLLWQQAHWLHACGTLVYERVAKRVMGVGDPDPVEVKNGLEKVERFGAVLNQCLEGKQFLVNNKVSLADLAIAAPLFYAVPAEIPIESFPNIKSWYERINALPAWQKSMPEFS